MFVCMSGEIMQVDVLVYNADMFLGSTVGRKM